jgi:processive 1,2-diacylglycerol beta-glucosyltransferase
MAEIQLFDKETGASAGEITRVQLQYLMDQLEEESSDDQDYFINRPTLELLEEQTPDDDLIEVLREALGDRDEMEIRWEEA